MKTARSKKQHVAQMLGTSAAILVVAGTLGISPSVIAAAIVGATVVYIFAPS